MRLEPFDSVDGEPFSLSFDDVLLRRGMPQRRLRNGVGLNELDYGDVIFRFQDNGRLEEITAPAPVLHLGSVAVPFGNLAEFVCEQDPDVFERAGFIVSPRFGVAFDPTQPPWVTALAAHSLDEWETL